MTPAVKGNSARPSSSRSRTVTLTNHGGRLWLILVARPSMLEVRLPPRNVPADQVLTRREIAFPGGRSALVVRVPESVSGDDAAAALGLQPPRALVVLNGGTDELSPGLTATLGRTLADGLARVVSEEGLTVLTGGTDAGIFALFGKALADRRTAPCIGVAPANAVTWPGRDDAEAGPAPRNDLIPLEPHHSHFLLVESAQWGAETNALIGLSETLGAERPSIAILAGGGEGAKREVLEQIRRGRRVLALAGTGRFADELARAESSGITTDAETSEVAASGSVTVLGAAQPPASLAERVRAGLGLAEAKAKS
jgi:SLOG in TRPM, prokaryote